MSEPPATVLGRALAVLEALVRTTTRWPWPSWYGAPASPSPPSTGCWPTGHRQAQAPSRVGGRMPLHCTAIGKALLAHGGEELLRSVVDAGLERRTPRTLTAPGLLKRQLDKVVETGIAFEHEESAVGIVCVAAPVLSPNDRPVAAVSVTGPVTRFHPERHVAAVRAAAAGMAATLARRAALTAGSGAD